MYVLLKFGITDYCLGLHSLKVNSYSNILLLNLGHNFSIDF